MNIKISETVKETTWDAINKGMKCDIPTAAEIVSLSDLDKKIAQVSFAGNQQAVELNNEIGYLYSNYGISTWREIKSHRRIIGNLIIYVKRVIRKLTKFYVEPIVFDQNEWNLHCAHAIQSAKFLLDEKDREIAELRAEIKVQREKQQELEKKINDLM